MPRCYDAAPVAELTFVPAPLARRDDNVEANQQQYDGTTTDKTNLTYEECLAKLDAMSNIVKQRIEQHVQVDAIIGDLLAIEASLLSDCDEDSLYHLEAKLGEVMDLIATKKRNSGSLTE